MSAISAALLIFIFKKIQSSILPYIGRQAAPVLLVLICNIGHRTLPKIWVGYLSCAERTV